LLSRPGTPRKWQSRPIPTPTPPRPTLVTRARAARERNERLVTSYTAVAKQRIGVGIRALSRDRMLYRYETVARIQVAARLGELGRGIGAREGIPVVKRGDQLPEDLDFGVRDLVINPAEDVLRFIGGDDDEGFVYPLRKGGETGLQVRLGRHHHHHAPERQASPAPGAFISFRRRADWKLMSGTLWYDAETLGLVRAVLQAGQTVRAAVATSPPGRQGGRAVSG
jgi:hypothetical protein